MASNLTPLNATRASEDKNGEFRWVIAQTIGTFLGLFAIIFAVATLLIERVRRVRANDSRRFTSDASILGCFHVEPIPWYKSLLGVKTKGLQLPSIAGLIEAGDRGAWTSSVLDFMTENHSDQSWMQFYELVLSSIVGSSDALLEAWKSAEPVPSFLSRVRSKYHRDECVPNRWHAHRKMFDDKRLTNACRQPETTQGATQQHSQSSRLRSNVGKGLSRLTSTWIVRDKLCIGTSREELAALAIIMGVAFPKLENAVYLTGFGAFGLSLNISHAGHGWSLSLVQGSRLPRHAASMGSGYTTLMAKHLACGSVPFGQNDYWVRSVYLNDDVFNAIKSGDNIIDKRAFGGDSLEFLRRLPADKRIDAFYGTTKAKTQTGNQQSRVLPTSQLGVILHANGAEAGKWSRAVAGIAFGGLVPQAHPNIASAVKFTVAGSNFPGCVQSLERLIDTLYKLALEESDQNAELFGENVQERYDTRGHAFVNYTFPSENSNPPDAAAIFARYSNLLERVLSLSVGRLQNRTAAPQNPTASGAIVTTDDVFEAAAAEIEIIYEAAVAANSNNGSSSNTRNNEDLGTIIDEVIVRLTDSTNRANSSQQPVISLQDCAIIIRCILAAWAFTVPLINVRQATQTAQAPTTRSGQNVVSNEIVLWSLPPVSAFC